MTAKDSAILTEYLDYILTGMEGGNAETGPSGPGTAIAAGILDIDSLEAETQPVGRGLKQLAAWLTEMREYAAALSKGHLDTPFPSRYNPLCYGMLKNDTGEHDRVWEYHDETADRWYLADCFSMEWQERESHAYVIEEVTDEKKKERKLKDMAYHDVMTGIYNRRYMQEEVDESLRQKRPFTFCYIDLDHLKTVNDTFGHAEGDAYIQCIVRRIQYEIRKDDIFARIGGDEFAVLFYQDAETAIHKRMEHALLAVKRELSEKKSYSGGFSYGILSSGSGHFSTYREVLKNADSKMYECKISHREREKE